jgi:AcrR family transcriptional regulator
MDRRERRKARTRRALAEAALAQFAARGFDATTVESICEQADVAISTFYVYFESKEAAAFGGDDERAAAVEGILRDRPAGEALHATLRRASHAVVDLDLRAPAELEARRALIAREPKLAAYAARLQARNVERFARIIANELRTDAATDPRPRVVVNALFGALNAAWTTRAGAELHRVVDRAHDTLDLGFARALDRQLSVASAEECRE